MNKRKIFSTIMVIVMLVALLPAMALAQVTEVKQAPSYFEQLSNWKISPSVPGTTCGLPGGADADISKPDYNTSGWVDAVAPSTVLGNLIDAGVYDEFFMDRSGTTDEWYNRQFTSIRSADFDEPWWYSTDFALPASEAGKRVTIAIGGMTYMADFYVNGVQVFNELTNINDKYDLWNGPPVYGLAQGDANDYTDITNVGSNRAAQFGTLDLDSYRNLIVGSFRRFDIDITDYLNPVGTSNNLKFKITKPISQQDLTYHWVDWHPRPVDSMMGLTGVVSIGTSGPVRLNNPAVSTVVSDDLNTAAVTLYCDATNLTDAAVTGTVTAVVNDPDGLTVAIVQKNVTIPSKVYNVEMIFRPADFPALNMSDPKLWYPAGSGDQPLYNINWSFTYDGAISDALTHRAGLRQLSYEINVTPLGNQNRATVTSNAGANMAQFYFNHKPVLLKGGGYCPTDLFLRHDPVKNQGVIDNMLYSGLNMFRDEGKFFDNDLLDLCDENGIVVMTGWCCCDRHQSPNSWSKCERFWGYEEQYAQTKNLRQHACGGLWFNGSDQPASFSQSSRSNSWMVEEMYHMIEAKCRWDVIGATAPSSCLDSSKLLGNINGGFHMDSTYENNATTYFYSPWGAQLNGEGPFGFISEGLGGSNIPSIESLKKIIARDNIFPYNATSYADFSAWSTHSNIIALVTLAENAYGASTSLESWHAKATAQCYDQYRAQYEAINYFRFKNNTGLVNWMLNSARPNMYWSEFDFYMNPTAATFGIAKANEPLHIMYNPYDKDISVINGTFNAYPGMTAEVSIYNLDGKLINKPLVKTFDVAPDGASPTTVYGTMANYTSTNAQALKWAVKEADGRTSFRNGWHYDEVTGAFTPMNYNYFGQIKDAYGVNILWGYDDIEASLTAPMSDVYFLRLDLKDSAGNVASTNSYAVPYRGDITAATGWMYGAPVAVGDLSALNSLPALSASELTCTQTGSAVVGENVVQTVVVSNNSPYVAHNVLLAAYPDNTLTDLIGAVQFTDNMFILLPGESRTIDVTHRKSNLAGDAVITMTCYNNQVSGDKPVRFKNVYTGLGIGQGRSLSNGKPVTGSGGGTPGNLTALPAECLTLAVEGKTFMDSAISYLRNSISDGSPTYYTYSPTITNGGAWFYVDLGESKAFDEVMLRFSGSRNLRGRPDGIVIAGSDSASGPWTDLAAYNNVGGSIMTDIVLDKTAKYRYVRATLTGAAYTSATALQTAYNVQGMDIYAFDNYVNVNVNGEGTVTAGGKTITKDTYANQKIVAVEPDGSAELTFTPAGEVALVRVLADGVDISNKLVDKGGSRSLTLSGLSGDVDLEVYFGIQAYLSSGTVTYINDDAEYVLSLANTKDVLAVELEFEIDGNMLAGKGLVGLNGFSNMNNILWIHAGDNRWRGTVTMALPSGTTTGLTSVAPVDIAKFVYTPKGYGNATMNLLSARAVVKLDDTMKYIWAQIMDEAATTIVARSKYDLNRDGTVDALDLGIMLLYCGFNANALGWDDFIKVNDIWGNGVPASMCDVNGDGTIDMLDLLDLFIHYTK